MAHLESNYFLPPGGLHFSQSFSYWNIFFHCNFICSNDMFLLIINTIFTPFDHMQRQYPPTVIYAARAQLTFFVAFLFLGGIAQQASFHHSQADDLPGQPLGKGFHQEKEQVVRFRYL